MVQTIKQSYPHGSADLGEIENGRYSLYHKGQAVSPEAWDGFVRPGLSVDLELWKCDPIKFKDALGRKFTFPWHLVKTSEVSVHYCFNSFGHEPDRSTDNTGHQGNDKPGLPPRGNHRSSSLRRPLRPGGSGEYDNNAQRVGACHQARDEYWDENVARATVPSGHWTVLCTPSVQPTAWILAGTTTTAPTGSGGPLSASSGRGPAASGRGQTSATTTTTISRIATSATEAGHEAGYLGPERTATAAVGGGGGDPRRTCI